MPSSAAADRTRRILVVEDEDEVQILVARILRSMGYQVETEADGGAALTQIEAARPDLVVLDLIIPGVDGWEVLQRLATQPNPPPVVILTGRGDYDTFARGVRAGAMAYVVKPFRFHELAATCQRVLQAAAFRERDGVRERRREPRRFLIVEVDVLGRDDHALTTGELLDLSLGGGRLELAIGLAVGDSVRLAFHLPGAAPLRLTGEVRWRSETTRGYVHGLQFSGLAAQDRSLLVALLSPAG